MLSIHSRMNLNHFSMHWNRFISIKKISDDVLKRPFAPWRPLLSERWLLAYGFDYLPSRSVKGFQQSIVNLKQLRFLRFQDLNTGSIIGNILLTFEKMIKLNKWIFKVKTSAFEFSKYPKCQIFESSEVLEPFQNFNPFNDIKLALEVLHNSFNPLQTRFMTFLSWKRDERSKIWID